MKKPTKKAKTVNISLNYELKWVQTQLLYTCPCCESTYQCYKDCIILKSTTRFKCRCGQGLIIGKRDVYKSPTLPIGVIGIEKRENKNNGGKNND